MYEDAPATRLLDLRCLHCNRPLVDAQSTSVLLGPICRMHVRYEELSPDVREEANKLIYVTAEVLRKGLDEANLGFVEDNCRRLAEIGLPQLADRVMERVFPFIEEMRQRQALEEARRRLEFEAQQESAERERIEEVLRAQREADRARRAADEARRAAQRLEPEAEGAVRPAAASPPPAKQTVDDWLKDGGYLSRVIPGYKVRPQQLALARRIAAIFSDTGHDRAEPSPVLLAEAPCGVGKSMAYLVASVVNGRHALVATSNIALQEQLIKKDLPTLAEAARIAGLTPPTYSLFKGRGNYVCHTRLRKAVESAQGHGRDAEFWGESGWSETLYAIAAWTAESSTGDRSDLERDMEVPPEVWGRICGDPDACKGCARGCFYGAAKTTAIRSDIVVSNHHQLWFMHLLGGPQHQVLGTKDAIVIDEAHKFADAGRSSAGWRIGSSLQHEFVTDLQDLWASDETGRAVRRGESDVNEADQIVRRYGLLQEALAELENDARIHDRIHPRIRGGLRQIPGSNAVVGFCDELVGLLSASLVRAKCRYEMLRPDDVRERRRFEGLMRRVSNLRDRLTILTEGDDRFVVWFERTKDGKRCRVEARMLDVDYLAQALLHEQPSVLVSATLADTVVEGVAKFTLVERELGLRDDLRVGELVVGSPFDYGTQSILWDVRMRTPVDAGTDYAQEAAEVVARAADRVGGRTLVLCTANQMMREIASFLRAQKKFLVLVQGEAVGRTELVRRFKTAEQPTILLGVNTFWEGVDVPGDALRVLVVAKLPFPQLKDPVLSALGDRCEAEGRKSFFVESLPRAVLMFRQGVGRLIRTETDKGMFIVLDPRIWSKRYGRDFLQAGLRGVPITSDLEIAMESVA